MKAEDRRAIRRARADLRLMHHAEHGRGPLTGGLWIGLSGVIFCTFMVGFDLAARSWLAFGLMVPLVVLNTWLLLRGIRQETFILIRAASQAGYVLGRQEADDA